MGDGVDVQGRPDRIRGAARDFDAMNLTGDIAWLPAVFSGGMREGEGFSRTDLDRVRAAERFLTEVRQGVAGLVEILRECADCYEHAGNLTADQFAVLAKRANDPNLPQLLGNFPGQP
ncbi:hypothetical protein [Amycolatopsis sp.]|uniref:hypothetical protein n=1 Tax=Amycolatopsis sp. TaxID=37632 RepID=UPI002C97A8E7|nr:hypothetical protein [Amycolatopsis sp.]HVV09003.1 hypothetical protein [Amycolatopsis sp.]